DVFRFPVFSTLGANTFRGTFDLGSDARTQTRTPVSIIDGNTTPNTRRYTFGPSSVWPDYNVIDANWQQ
ncbi:MAG: hypothetical protein LBH73_07515, partial [Spirochaetaceae bacterium]|nr:hypothetical protein [Spirochaetaceae bacterium]